METERRRDKGMKRNTSHRKQTDRRRIEEDRERGREKWSRDGQKEIRR